MTSPTPWVAVDVETSGTTPSQHRVLSVAAMTLDPAGHIVDSFYAVVNPGVDPGPVHIHGLTPAILAGKPSFESVWPQLKKLLDGRTAVAHNAGFDLSFLQAEVSRFDEQLPCTHFVDTVALAGSLRLGSANLKLGTLADFFHIDQQDAHNAQDDTRVLAHIFAHLLQHSAQRTMPVTSNYLPDFHAHPTTGMLTHKLKTAALAGSGIPNPGKYQPGQPLSAGMDIVIAWDVTENLTAVYEKISHHGMRLVEKMTAGTSLVICDTPNPVKGPGAWARDRKIAVVDSGTFLQLCADLGEGEPVGQATLF